VIEINGDLRLSAPRRIVYLLRNAAVNLASLASPLATQAFRDSGPALSLSSPARYWCDEFLARELPRLLPPGEVSVLEIGCGSGSLCRRLSEMGYCGRYVGIDVGHRFDRSPVQGFDAAFVNADVASWRPDERFDLVISVSVLEHVEADARVIDAMRGWLRPGGLQVHLVPAAAGLFLYLWHGWRQYNRRAVAQRFPKATVWRLGGIVSFSVHFFCITVGELLLPLRLRSRFPHIYRRLLELARFDARLAMAPANFYAVVERAP
jgi:SAM-dependent methyltransferase